MKQCPPGMFYTTYLHSNLSGPTGTGTLLVLKGQFLVLDLYLNIWQGLMISPLLNFPPSPPKYLTQCVAQTLRIVVILVILLVQFAVLFSLKTWRTSPPSSGPSTAIQISLARLVSAPSPIPIPHGFFPPMIKNPVLIPVWYKVYIVLLQANTM